MEGWPLAEKTYTTVQGETWDQIAVKVYGSETLMYRLIQANPDHRETLFFAAGETLSVPVVEAAREVTIPPWKRR